MQWAITTDGINVLYVDSANEANDSAKQRPEFGLNGNDLN